MAESAKQEIGPEDDALENVCACLSKCEDALFGCVREYPVEPRLCALTFRNCAELCAAMGN